MNRTLITAALIGLAVAVNTATAQLPRDTALESAVRTWYLQYFNREPDPAGMANWVRLMRDGMPAEEVQGRLLGSPEYFDIQGGRPRRFIRGLYQDVLGTDPRPEESDYWLSRLEMLAPSGNERDGVALEFLQYVRGLTEQHVGFGEQAPPAGPPPQAVPLDGFGCHARQEPAGLRVYGVREDSFAGRLGLQTGDIISACDGRAVRSIEDFRKVVSTKATHQLGLVRGDMPCSAALTTADRSVTVARAVTTVRRIEEQVVVLPEIGCTVTRDDAGLRCRSVQAESVAARLGLRPGDLLLGVDDRPVGSVEEFRRVFATASAVNHRLNLERAGQPGWAVMGRTPARPAWGATEPVRFARREVEVIDVPDLGCRVRAEEAGLRVAGLQPGLPAALLGLQEGDVIRGIDGRPVRTVEQLRALTVQQKSKQRVAVDVRRGSEGFRGYFEADEKLKVKKKVKKFKDDDDD